MKKLVLLVMVLGFSTACATTGNYEKILQTWVGSPVDNLVGSWGPPQSQYKLSGGGMVIEYSRSSTGTVGGYTSSQPVTTYNIDGSYSTTYVTTTTPSYNVQYSCRTIFDVDKNNIITSWRWEGNSCIAYDPDG
jgi:hypothetical protein